MLGGQLVKQTHTFFSDVKYAAGKRGFNLGKQMVEEVNQYDNITVLTSMSAVGYYPNENTMLLVGQDDSSMRIKAEKYLISTGAYEKNLIFDNNDLPGNRGLMIGTGNVALMVAYHLIQAGVEVAGVVAPSLRRIRGYHVHAAKLRRHGIPIITRHTITKAFGTDKVTGAEIVELDNNYQRNRAENRL